MPEKAVDIGAQEQVVLIQAKKEGKDDLKTDVKGEEEEQKPEEEGQIDIEVIEEEEGGLVKENIEGGEKKNKKEEKKIDLIASIAVSSDIWNPSSQTF